MTVPRDVASFVEFVRRSNFGVFDGTSRLEDLAAKAPRRGLSGIALDDHDLSNVRPL